MAKIDAAHNRIFKKVFVCKKCRTKIRAQPRKVAEGKIKCRKCKSNLLRPKKKKISK